MALTPKKSLGQHWLKDRRVLGKIVSACLPAAGVLEIGPGQGVLTRPLCESAEVVAIEIDPRSVDELAKSVPQARVVLADVLKVDLTKLLDELPKPRTLVSNLPYYITAAVVEKVCHAADSLDRAVLMMQTEVAERLAAKAGDSARGSLSVFVQFFFDIEHVCNAPASAFSPPPKVSSRVLKLTPRPGRTRDDAFFSLVRPGFKQPRKTLANNLAASGIAKGDIEKALDEAGISRSARPHQLSEAEWLRLEAQVRGAKK